MKRKQFPGGASTEMRFMECPVEVVEGRAEGEKPRVRIAISSENVVERNFYGMAWREVLDHAPGSVQMGRLKSGSAPFLLDHDTRTMIGNLEDATLDGDRVLRADVHYGDSPEADQAYRDMAVTKIRRNVSVGYVVKRWKLIEEDVELGDLWRATLWEPCEASSVPIPADTSVGVGRANGSVGFVPVETEDAEPTSGGARTAAVVVSPLANGGAQMKKVLVNGRLAEVDDTDQRPEASPAEVAHAERAAADAGEKRDRNAEIAEIMDFCSGNGVAVKREWVQEGITPGEYAMRLLREKGTLGRAQPGAEIGLNAKEQREYSYARAIAIGAGLNPLGSDDLALKPEGLEWDVHRELEKKLPVNFERKGGILVPLRVGDGRAKRSLVSTTATKGAEMVWDTQGELIELLRNRTAVLRMGARMLTGLTGPVVFPRKTGGMTFYWTAEDPAAAVAESDMTLGMVQLQPKSLMGATSYSRQLLAQAPSGGFDVESMVRDEMAIGHSLAIDLACLHGTGGSGQPLGIFNSPDVLTAAVAAPPTWKSLVKVISGMAGVNAPTESLGWITTPEAAGMFMFTLKDSVAGAGYLWDGTVTDGQMVGYRATATNQILKAMTSVAVPSGGALHGIVCGDFSQQIIGSWGALELVVDPFTSKKKALVEVASFQLMDAVIRHGSAFNVGVLTISA